MHPVIMRQLTADHIREMQATAENYRLARQARRARHDELPYASARSR